MKLGIDEENCYEIDSDTESPFLSEYDGKLYTYFVPA